MGWTLPGTGYDLFMLPLEIAIFRRLRRSLIPHLSGRILEIGAGTGANLPHYSSSARVTALDPGFRNLRSIAQLTPQRTTDIIVAEAERLPFSANQFDHVVASLTFCSLPGPRSALAEIERVLVPGGWVTLIEHVRGEARWARAATRLLAPLWFSLNHSCHLDRDTTALIQESELRIVARTGFIGGLVQVIAARKNG